MIRFLLALLVCSIALHAADEPPLRKLTFITGTVAVNNGLARIALPENCRYLAGEDARYWVETVWNNPPDAKTVGMIMPEELATWYSAAAAGTPPEQHPERSWGIVVSWGGETGHVEDDDAKSIDYAALLKEMQDAVAAGAAEREKAGYGRMELLGWAEAPSYDAAGKKLYWAKSIRFNGEADPTLNYCVRMLGARGVLQLNAVGEVKDLPQISAAAKAVLAQSEFTQGNRYADFKSGVDPVAAGGIAALVVGGVIAKKAGLLAVFGLVLLKFAKILIVPVVLAGGWIIKRVRGA